jgi:hypothetical protein
VWYYWHNINLSPASGGTLQKYAIPTQTVSDHCFADRTTLSSGMLIQGLTCNDSRAAWGMVSTIPYQRYSQFHHLQFINSLNHFHMFQSNSNALQWPTTFLNCHFSELSSSQIIVILVGLVLGSGLRVMVRVRVNKIWKNDNSEEWRVNARCTFS